MNYIKLPSGGYVNLNAILDVAEDSMTMTLYKVRRALAVKAVGGGVHLYTDDDADAIIAALEQHMENARRPMMVPTIMNDLSSAHLLAKRIVEERDE